MERTRKAIQAEIARLKEMKPNVLQFSAFGDDHHAAIDAQIEVLEGDMSEDECYDSIKFSENETILEECLYAARWARGEEKNAPSANWVELVR